MPDGQVQTQPHRSLTPTAPRGWQARIMANPKFQYWAARFPLTRRLVCREGQEIFDIMAGFCRSQVLMALADLRLPDALLAGPRRIDALADEAAIPPDRMQILIRAGAGLGLLRLRGDQVSLTRSGIAFATVPGLGAMVRHHKAFYRDLSDPLAFFRGNVDTELAAIWPYVFGAGAAQDPETAQAYSDLMAQSQVLVAQDTLDAVSLRGVTRLLDIGGGTGAFLSVAGARYADLQLDLFDLPAVAPAAYARFDAAGQGARATVHSGSFRDDPLPQGADMISLIRVLYDHADATIVDVLRAAFDALPPGGRILISEPMSGGARPDPATDVYFALYTLAMRTGRTRSQAEIATHLRDAGFVGISTPHPRRAYVTSIVTAVRPD